LTIGSLSTRSYLIWNVSFDCTIPTIHPDVRPWLCLTSYRNRLSMVSAGRYRRRAFPAIKPNPLFPADFLRAESCEKCGCFRVRLPFQLCLGLVGPRARWGIFPLLGSRVPRWMPSRKCPLEAMFALAAPWVATYAATATMVIMISKSVQIMNSLISIFSLFDFWFF